MKQTGRIRFRLAHIFRPDQAHQCILPSVLGWFCAPAFSPVRAGRGNRIPLGRGRLGDWRPFGLLYLAGIPNGASRRSPLRRVGNCAVGPKGSGRSRQRHAAGRCRSVSGAPREVTREQSRRSRYGLGCSGWGGGLRRSPCFRHAARGRPREFSFGDSRRDG